MKRNKSTNDNYKLIKKKKKWKKIRSIIAGCVVLAVLGWFFTLRINLDAKTSNYDFTIPFEKREINTHVNAPGKVEMSDTEIISADVSQKIKSINVKIGDHVEQGDVLCEFESDELNKSIERYQKLISDTKAQNQLDDSNQTNTDSYRKQSYELAVQKASIEYEEAKSTYDATVSKYNEYYDKYYKAEDSSEIELYHNIYKQYEVQMDPLFEAVDTKKKAYDKAVKDRDEYIGAQNSANEIKQYKISSVDELQKTLDKLNKEKENLIVKANRSGVISECYVTEGGYSLNKELFKIGNLGQFRVDACISSADILDVKPGQEVSIITALTGSKKIDGKVTKVSEIFDGRGYTAEIEINDKSTMELLKPNINASVKIYTENRGSVDAVPYDAVFKDKDGKEYVFRAVKKGNEYKAEKVSVQTGLESDFYVEIVSSDLSEGDLVLGNGGLYKQGTKLNIK